MLCSGRMITTAVLVFKIFKFQSRLLYPGVSFYGPTLVKRLHQIRIDHDAHIRLQAWRE